MDLYYIIKAIVVAIVEGVTEFLPVSSTGHMIIVGNIIGFDDVNPEFANFFEVFIQAGAMFAIIFLYREKIWAILKSFIKLEKRGLNFAKALVIATIPAVLAGVLFEDMIDEHLFNVWTVLIGLVVGAVFLLFAEKVFRKNDALDEIENITWKKALGIGIFQCLSLWPGMSRSSSTITGGWIFGLGSKAAAEYSFFMALPVLFGAALFKTYKFFDKGHADLITSTEIVALIIGTVVAFVVALICVKGFISFISKKPMKYFAYYRIGISAILATLIALKVI